MVDFSRHSSVAKNYQWISDSFKKLKCEDPEREKFSNNASLSYSFETNRREGLKSENIDSLITSVRRSILNRSWKKRNES